MLVLFIECWGSNLSIQARVGKLNGDLHQPSIIRYESRSFSVIYLVSLAYRKGLIFGVKLSVVVPQAIGISLCNSYIVQGYMVYQSMVYISQYLPNFTKNINLPRIWHVDSINKFEGEVLLGKGTMRTMKGNY